MYKQQSNTTKRDVEILKNLEFVEGNVDPYPYIKKGSKGIVYVSLHVSNNLMVGNIEAIKEIGLVFMVVEGLQDYLYYEIKFSPNKRRAWFGQPHLIKKLENKFGKQI